MKWKRMALWKQRPKVQILCYVIVSLSNSPLWENQKELVDQGGSHSVGVELAGSCHQHGPRYAPEKTKDVRVDIMTCRSFK